MDKQGKEHDLQNEMMCRRKHHNAFGTKEWKLDGWKKRTEKIMTTSTTIEFGKHPCKKVRTELLENQQRKE